MKPTRRHLINAIAGTGLASTFVNCTPASRNSQSSDRPNILMIVLDDVGFADLTPYGGLIDTPSISKLAKQGLLYQNFHVTSLCAPTRASLLTGQNSHAVGVGTIAEFGTDRPGYQGYIRKDVVTLPAHLKAHGYNTYGVGKWHLSPVLEVNEYGPFTHWPSQRGFDKWYGFHGPIADHWHPELFEDTQASYPAKKDNYHLSTDLTDKMLSYLQSNKDKPFFAYIAFGACHWPLHVPRTYIDKYKNRFDAGWEALRQVIHEKQIKSGIIPNDTPLPSLNPDVPNWETLTQDEKRFAAKTMEVYAGFLEHTDEQIGRLLNHLDLSGLTKNTIVMVLSDNGASKEGQRLGMSDVRRNHYIEKEMPEELFEAIDLLGSDQSFTAYARGWTQASNTPLKFYKSKTFGGGVRAPLIIKWPDGGVPSGQIRRQFHHVCDLAPTLYELCGVPGLATDGQSLGYSFNSPNRKTPKEIQYFETHGDRAIWVDGWKAVALHEKGRNIEQDPWFLFHLPTDFNELTDLSEQFPEKLDAFKALWRLEAEKHSVLPMDDRTTANFAKRVATPRAEYNFIPFSPRLDRLSAPNIDRYSHEIKASFQLAKGLATGVILAAGTSMAGYELFLKNGYLFYVYAYSRSEHTILKSKGKLEKGEHSVCLKMILRDDLSAHAELWVNGAITARDDIPKLWKLYAASAGVRCGFNPHSPISRLYIGDGKFEGQLDPVKVYLSIPD